MPRIWDEWLDSVVYLYASVEDAKGGERYGGSGFLMSVKSESHPDYLYTYAVTNRHVIAGGGTVVRVNTMDGNTDILDLREDDWEFHANGDDIAMALVDLPSEDHRAKAVQKETCVTEGLHRFLGIGPGDEVFILSRFVNVGGKQTNQPVVRFGNVAMKPTMVRSGLGYDVLSYLVESRSLSGMSGSPVYVYFPQREEWKVKDAMEPMARLMRGPFLLGIDWGHPPVYDKIVDKGGKEHPEGWRVQANSGFMAVAPAWKLVEMLDGEELAINRRKLDSIRRERAAADD